MWAALAPKSSQGPKGCLVFLFVDKRITGTTLQNIRRRHFQHNPLCVLCLAKVPQMAKVATELDHIIPLHKGGTDTQDNRQGLCFDCHLEKSKTERGHEYYPKITIGIDGYPK